MLQLCKAVRKQILQGSASKLPPALSQVCLLQRVAPKLLSVLQCVLELSKAVGAEGLVAGQVVDMKSERGEGEPRE